MIAAGFHHTLILAKTGLVYAMGANNAG